MKCANSFGMVQSFWQSTLTLVFTVLLFSFHMTHCVCKVENEYSTLIFLLHLCAYKKYLQAYQSHETHR